MDIDIITDKVLAFASRGTFSMDEAAEVLHVRRANAVPVTRRAILRRLASPFALALNGQSVDLLKERLAGATLSEANLNFLARNAAWSGSVPILDWVHATNPTLASFESAHSPHFFMDMTYALAFMAVSRGHLQVLEWIERKGIGLRGRTASIAAAASRLGLVHAVQWLSEYAARHSVEFYRPAHWDLAFHRDVKVDAVIATVAWWKSFLGNDGFDPARLQMGTAIPAGCCDFDAKVEWFCDTLHEYGREIEWPRITSVDFMALLISGDFDQFAVRRANTEGKAQRMTYSTYELDLLCEHGSPRFLDWWWELCTTPGSGFRFDPFWKPRGPFVKANVAEWWLAKVREGAVDASIFKFEGMDGEPPSFDSIGILNDDNLPDVDMLEWWFQHQDLAGVSLAVTPGMLERYVQHGMLAHFQWCWSKDPANLPVTPQVMESIVSVGDIGLLAWLWSVHQSHGTPFPLISPNPPPISNMTPPRLELVLDLLWDAFGDQCSLFTSDKDSSTAEATILACWKASNFQQVDWWYAMHKATELNTG
ncbi:hypothetical protein BC828DRAFT_402913 [Blastocladiella britannica]|nr:hypothetical protein BC828DRAFT_402913 [Blastocladiella britannica]